MGGDAVPVAEDTGFAQVRFKCLMDRSAEGIIEHQTMSTINEVRV